MRQFVNPKYERKDGEDLYEYGLRLIEIKMEQKPDDLDWEDIVEAAQLDCHRDSLRKAASVTPYSGYAVAQHFKRKYSAEDRPDKEQYLGELDIKIAEVRKEAKRFFDQRREFNKLVDRIGRAENLEDRLAEAAVALNESVPLSMDKRRDKPSVYRITRVDPVSYAVGSEREEDGLIQWSVLQDQLNTATDSVELMIADYHAATSGGVEEVPGSTASLILTDLDGDFRLASGETKQVQVRCLTADGDPIDPPQYHLECDFGGAVSIIAEEDGVITLQAKSDPSYVGKQIEIKAINDELACEAVITIQIVNW